MVGVFAGNLHTTTAACIGAKRSILSSSGVPADPAPDVYAQIMELIQGLQAPETTDMEQISMLIDADLLPAVYDKSGAILTNETGNVVLRY